MLISENKDPSLNVPLEDVILSLVEEGDTGNVCRFWVNRECLVSGPVRHPSHGWYREDLARAMAIEVYVRSSGGGVVYHDLGNLNWSFYLPTDGQSYVPPVRAFREAADLVCEVLSDFGIEARYSPPNRIDVHGRKVSGMAGLSRTRALLVHGTLLISSDIAKLNLLCVPPPSCPPVLNLSSLNPELTIGKFIERFLRHLDQRGCEYSVHRTEEYLRTVFPTSHSSSERAALGVDQL